MALAEINWNPSSRDLRIFSIALGCLLALISLISFRASASVPLAVMLSGIAVLIMVIGFLAPATVKPVYLGWMILLFPVRWSVSCLLIAVVYYLVMTPIGFALRLLGHDLVGRRFDAQASSYWRRERRIRQEQDYFRQF
ncbi:SxtJ family membrane protein [Gimesia sp.]|uniref:SxtJ family membrane protein n=1 Tax=Gimesia sp. TaxID=2024833 RepID=UPI000C55DAF1|nr:SxtJ family membrane protein [Gimesia sp.]MAX39507.1 hypothetical protein [Gimesia sp.]HAH49223.1 hypothetical protein [Planctomycetaceae bacterium]HBL46244.1 hypothetical protein [Planctomycetaceae bacterium]|tara:strand:- start:13322 stop:13738 length:417 start_codon:yes stop_codon:yes gene_type:complete